MSILVIDVGTSGLRAAIVRPDATVDHVHYRAAPADTPFPGLVEFDAARAGRRRARGRPRPRWPSGGPVDAVGITNQRASTIVWDRAHRRAGRPGARLAGPAHGRRLPRRCSRARPRDLAPNQSATKVAWLLDTLRPRPRPGPLLRHGRHVGRLDAVATARCTSPTARTPASPACSTATARRGTTRCSTRSRIPTVDAARRSSTRPASSARPPRLPGAPADRRHRRRPAGARSSARAASRPGLAKITFGTGGMLDLCTGARTAGHRRPRPARHASRSSPGAAAATITWGVEAIMLSAGTNVEWLRRRPRHPRRRAAESHDVAAACDDTGGVRVRAGAARPRARRSGTTAPAARCSASPGAPAGPRSCGPCSRASPSGAPTWSRRPRPTAGVADPGAAGRRRHERQPDVRAGARRRHAAPGRGLPGHRGHHARRRPSSPGWPSARGRAWTTSPPAGAPARSVEPAGRSTATGGPTPSIAPAAGYPTCPRSTSRVAPLGPGQEGCGRHRTSNCITMPGKDHSLVDTTALGEHGPASRRRFLQAVGLGGALSALPLVARSAGAQSGSTTTAAAGSETTASATPVTTTTAPPRRPTADDEIAARLRAVDRAQRHCGVRGRARSGRRARRSRRTSTPSSRSSVSTTRRTGSPCRVCSAGRRPAPPTRPLDDEFGPLFTTGSLDEVLTAAIALEDDRRRHAPDAARQLQGTDGAALIASILRHRGPPRHRAQRTERERRADARVRPRARRRCPDPRRLPGGVTPMVDRTDDIDAPSFLDRRGFLRLGGFTVAATAVLAACGSDEGAGPEEITQAGSAPAGSRGPERRRHRQHAAAHRHLAPLQRHGRDRHGARSRRRSAPRWPPPPSRTCRSCRSRPTRGRSDHEHRRSAVRGEEPRLRHTGDPARRCAARGQPKPEKPIRSDSSTPSRRSRRRRAGNGSVAVPSGPALAVMQIGAVHARVATVFARIISPENIVTLDDFATAAPAAAAAASTTTVETGLPTTVGGAAAAPEGRRPATPTSPCTRCRQPSARWHRSRSCSAMSTSSTGRRSASRSTSRRRASTR